MVIDSDPIEIAVAGDADFERRRLAEPGGGYQEYARTIVVHAIVAIIANTGRRNLERWTTSAPRGSSKDEQKTIFEARVRRFVHNAIRDRINAGGHVALTALNSPDPHVRAAPMLKAAPEEDLEQRHVAQDLKGPPAMRSDGIAAQLRVEGPYDAEPPSAPALRRARKWLSSNALDWELRVMSTEPLKLDLFAGQRYGGRLLTCLVANRSGDERDRANSIVAMTLKMIVDQTDATAIERVASDIDIPSLDERTYAADVLQLYRTDILSQIDLAIDRGGYEALKGILSQLNGRAK